MKVAIVMGSISDWPVMKETADVLDSFEIPYEKKIISAHRMPLELTEFANNAKNEHFDVIIAGAGGAAHLPGMMAANTSLPVIGVPIQTKALNGVDSLLSIVQMPFGVPVNTVAIGTAGAKNAGISAAEILAINDEKLTHKILNFKEKQHDEAVDTNDKL